MIKVYVSDSFAMGDLSIYVVQEGDGPRRLLRLSDDPAHFSRSWEEVHEAAVAEPARPTIRLDDDTARALLDALTRHYQGAEDTRALRKDYDAERARVDKLIHTITEVIQS